MTGAGIKGIGSALPQTLITNDDLAARIDTTDAWIQRRTGIKQRYHLQGDETLSDLATEAGKIALEDAGLDGKELDWVLMSTVTPDFATPSVAPTVARKLGAFEIPAIDMSGACAGFLYAMDQAGALIESGRAEHVLVLGAEALSRILGDMTDRSTAVLFADGAGAAVVSRNQNGGPSTRFVLGTDGISERHLWVDRDVRLVNMNGQEVYRQAVERMTAATRQALDQEGLTVDDIDLLVPHQANARIVDTVSKELGVPHEKVMYDVERVANTSAASIPLALHRAEREGRLKPGDIVGVAAFGAGFVWGAGIIRWKEDHAG